ncbi:hypothetical protein [Mucilaginibacter xinganensis]|uniref:Uncharacterized protein n=1 Tax=Mucilaginibacter xinganensis TaxID=1234841 RepID=A0A223P2T2_9SPHI|nr:hypothetical protein [Mucilaginibacter xinganensis]ASU36376.1 hypothetical protein MuYL_4491 [Mucilaginibacter xinganensis]
MKKVVKTDQPAKAEIISEVRVNQNSSQKTYLQHKAFDHSHGRVNKTPFGINHEPGCF